MIRLLGIWDCLTSQQVVDIVRLLISQGKELSEVGEIICEHCVAPDTASGAGIGCDNMTILVIAILNGRTKEEWYSWITDRVKQGYGHPTPDALPQLYSQSRLMNFRIRRQAEEAREKEIQERRASGGMLAGSSGFGGGITRILGSSGGISFHPGGTIMSDNGTLMFGNDDDSDDDDSDDMDTDGPSSRSFFSHTFGFAQDTPDMTKSLKEQLDELDRDSGEEKDTEGGASIVEVDGDSKSDHADGKSSPPPPKPLPNGDSKEANPPQLASKPGSDEPRPAVKAEGPLKG